MLSQDHTNDALGLLKKFVEDIGKNVCSPETECIELVFCAKNTKGQVCRMSLASGQISPVEHWKMTLAIIERLEDMGRDIENAIELKKKEDAHVQ